MAPSSSLESTWSAQSDLPALDPELAEESPSANKSGKIGRYDIVRRLGEGEFAAVFECSKTEGDDPRVSYAVKAINKSKVQRHSSILKSKRNIRRVNFEVMAMRRFQHAGICQLYDVMQSGQFVYLVLEIGERDLFNFLDDHPDGCPEIIIKQIMRILALGLRHCHNKGIAHRDIKPENVLVLGEPTEWIKKNNAESGIVKLCDFGLCAAIHDGCMLNDFVGSPGFFAPELMMRRQYDGALADMWSIGAVMVEMLLGHRTFDSVWCPPYEHLHDVNAFSSGICEAVSRVKLGSLQTPPSEPVRKLMEQLLQIEPERRSSIEEICNGAWFGLLKSSPNGAMQMLRLTFDRDRASFEQSATSNKAERRVAYRETPRQADRKALQTTSGLASIPSLNSASNLVDDDDDPIKPPPSPRGALPASSPSSAVVAPDPGSATLFNPPLKTPAEVAFRMKNNAANRSDEASRPPMLGGAGNTVRLPNLGSSRSTGSEGHEEGDLLRCKTPDAPSDSRGSNSSIEKSTRIFL